MARRNRSRGAPEAEQRALEESLAQIRVRGWFRDRPIVGQWEGRYYVVYFKNLPVCRLAWVNASDGKWECAIYRFTKDSFGSDGLFFPMRGDPREAVEMALGAYEHQCVK
jgi:hypothetical protein